MIMMMMIIMMLYRCVHLINHTHDKAGVGMDVKLRSGSIFLQNFTLDIFQSIFIILYFHSILWKIFYPCQGPWSVSV